jgi:hypothetical protein
MATGNRCTDQYRVERTKCGCHPETCCCPDFSLWSGNYLVARGSNESELRKLADAGNKGAAETKATRTYVAVVEPHHDRMKIGDRVVMIERIYAALGMDLPVCPHGLRYVENTCGPCSQGRPNRTPEHPETTVQPDEKCGNCGDDYSKHLGERLICPDAAMPDIYRWTAEPTQVKAGG